MLWSSRAAQFFACRISLMMRAKLRHQHCYVIDNISRLRRLRCRAAQPDSYFAGDSSRIKTNEAGPQSGKATQGAIKGLKTRPALPV